MPEKLIDPELTRHVILTGEEHRQRAAGTHADQAARVQAGVQRRIHALEAEERSFLNEAARFAPDSAEHRHSMHRARGVRLDIDRLKKDGGAA
jgi:hypothetical protein